MAPFAGSTCRNARISALFFGRHPAQKGPSRTARYTGTRTKHRWRKLRNTLMWAAFGNQGKFLILLFRAFYWMSFIRSSRNCLVNWFKIIKLRCIKCYNILYSCIGEDLLQTKVQTYLKRLNNLWFQPRTIIWLRLSELKWKWKITSKSILWRLVC